MDRGRPLKPLEVSGSTREELESLSRSLSLAAGLVSRAKIVLLCADGFDNKAVAEEVGTSRQTVGKWRERFRTQGLMGLYDDAGRESRAPSKMTSWCCCARHSTPSLPTAARIGVAVPWPKTGVSKSTVHRVWKAFNIQPHRQKHFKLQPIRSSSRRSTISSDSTSTHPTTRGALRRREGPDPGVGANPASAAPWARIRRRRHAWLHPSRHHHPLRRPRRGHRPDPGVQATAASGVSELSQAH